MIGYRFIERDEGKPEVGAVLPNSYVWDGDDPTDEELNGTCAFDSMAGFERYATWSKGAGWLVTVESDEYSYGDLDGEIVMRSATVVDVQDW